MPDITMCINEECNKVEKCYRSKKSGTKPSERQSHTMFYEDDNGECTYFVQKFKG